MATRLLLAVGALLVGLWLAGNLRSVEREADALTEMGQALKDGGLPSDVNRASGTFRDARRFGPDAQLKLREAGILVFARPERSARLLGEVLRAEPDNVDAWVLMYSMSKSPRDPVAVRARRRAIALDPEAARQIERFEAAR